MRWLRAVLRIVSASVRVVSVLVVGLEANLIFLLADFEVWK
nr:hypothetical protein [Methanophagales archaeon]